MLHAQFGTSYEAKLAENRLIRGFLAAFGMLGEIYALSGA